MDAESKTIFEIRLDYAMFHKYNTLNNRLFELNHDYWIPDWENFRAESKDDECRIIICGAGHDGVRTYKLLKQAGENVCAFMDNNSTKHKKEIIDGVLALPLDDVHNLFPDATYVLASVKYCDSLYEQLISYGIRRNKIFYPCYRRLLGFNGNQYFDLPELQAVPGEVFIDAGSYNGKTAVKFSDWCGGKYEHIYTMDPDPLCADRINKTIKEYALQNITFVPFGASDKTTELHFSANGMASGSISNAGEVVIPVTSIDDMLQGKKATFIKMDIEGAELSALQGARKTIEKYHPKLAICAYHKNMDIVDLAEYILQIDDSYKLYFRHYSSCEWETVLYAI